MKPSLFDQIAHRVRGDEKTVPVLRLDAQPAGCGRKDDQMGSARIQNQSQSLMNRSGRLRCDDHLPFVLLKIERRAGVSLFQFPVLVKLYISLPVINQVVEVREKV